ncbi:hypothetical protein [Amorphus sp. 3PC139-8]|uniref:hypothetical protein n=1 Tax=Amorphus sp. 3PC139-8 TaxID=2735676 RepID=UPI00345D5480
MADTTREAKIVVRADDRATRTFRSIGRNMQAMARNTGLSRMAREMRGVGRAARPLMGASAGLVRSLGALSGIAAALSFAGAAASMRSFANEMDGLAKLGRQVGFTVQQLRDLHYTGELIGVSGETIDASVQAMTKRIGELKAGTGSLNTYLKKTNPALLEQLKNTTSGAEAFELLISAMRDLPAAERNAFAAAAFSRSGQNLVRFAQESGEAIRNYIKEGRNLGGVVSDEDAAAAEAFNDELFRTSYALKGLKVTIGKELLPQITPMITSLKEWVATNKEVVSGRLLGGLDTMVDLFDRVNWSRVGRTFTAVARAGRDLAQSLSGFVGGPENLILGSLGALAAAPFAGAIAGLAGLAVAVGRLGVALLATRIGRLAAIATAAAKLYDVVSGSNSFGEFVENMKNLSALDWAMIGFGAAGLVGSMRDIISLSKRAAGGLRTYAGAAKAAAGVPAPASVPAAGSGTGVVAGGASPAPKAGGYGIGFGRMAFTVLNVGSLVANELRMPTEKKVERARTNSETMNEWANDSVFGPVNSFLNNLGDDLRSVFFDYVKAARQVSPVSRSDAPAASRSYPSAADRKAFRHGVKRDADELQSALTEAGDKGGQGLADGVAAGGAEAQASIAQTVRAISNLFAGQDFYASGLASMRQLAAGIRAGLPEAKGAASDAATAVADHFPQSPAKLGPLKNLPKMGGEIVRQLAGGMNPAAAGLAAAGVAAAVHGGLAMPAGARTGTAPDIGALRAEIASLRAELSAPAPRRDERVGVSRLEIAIRGAPRGASLAYSEPSGHVFDDVRLDTGRSMPRGKG